MKHIKEYHKYNNIYFHGTVAKIPYENFDKNCDGSGVVSIGGKKYGGFFFTSIQENAEFYSEYFVAKVKIENIVVSNNRHPPSALVDSIKDNRNYLVKEVLDGAVMSDVVVVPMYNLNNIKILEWIFVGDEEFYFEQLDQMFDEEGIVNQDMISDIISMIDMDINFLLSIPIFKKYYDSKL